MMRLACVLSGLIALGVAGCQRGTVKTDLFQDDVWLSGSESTYRSFIAKREEGEIADIFLRFHDGRVFSFRDLTIDDLEPYAKSSYTTTIQGEPTEVCDMEGESWFSFRDGQLEYVNIGSGDLQDIEIGKAAEGPFFSLPAEKQSVVKVLGEAIGSRESVVGAP